MSVSQRRKIVCVGDEAVGKTSLLLRFTQNVFSELYNPTVEDTYTLENSDSPEFIDTAGAEAFDRLRPFSYTDAAEAIVCFSLNSPESLKEVEEKWVPEIKYFCGDVPFIVVGLKKDLRDNASFSDPTVSFFQGEETALKIGAYKYLECSARTGENVSAIFSDYINPSRKQAKQQLARFSSDIEMEDNPYKEGLPKLRKKSLAPTAAPKVKLAHKPSLPKMPVTPQKIPISPPLSPSKADKSPKSNKLIRDKSVSRDKTIKTPTKVADGARRGSVSTAAPNARITKRRGSTPALQINTVANIPVKQSLSPPSSPSSPIAPPPRGRSKSVANALYPVSESVTMRKKIGPTVPVTPTKKVSTAQLQRKLMK
ncbi:GTP-binding protein Rho1 [Nowakowskiella sp. JEL0407]|nr:GTP-binding protein Rho1 [Nowakowskiella sp. JEL0407]